jgi:hypothetical protein
VTLADRTRRLAPAGALAFAVLAMAAAATPVRAADPTFGTPTIESTFGEGITVSQPVTFDVIPRRVELLLTYADAPGPLVVEVPTPTATGATTLRNTMSVASDGHILPNTPVRARWRITPEDGAPITGPEVDTLYTDERFDWQTVTGDIVRVHWYEGGRDFGDRALRIGEDALRETAALLGVTEKDPVDFFIYGSLDDFYDALGPGTRENVGGQAVASIRTLFALIEPADIDQPWVESVVPHELVHLVFDTATGNPYHSPPHWLNEGLAVYLSDGYAPEYRNAIDTAGRSGAIVPLDGLASTFPASADGFFLGYAEGVSAVDFLVRTHGQDALVALIASYADGLTDDEAFEAAIGMDVAGFNDAWLADVGVEAAIRHGPKAAPAGPLPAAWGGPVVEPRRPAPSPGGVASTGQLVIVAAIVALGVIVLVWSRIRRDRRRRGAPGDPTS